MKISVNDQELFTLNDIKQMVILNDILKESFDDDMKRRLFYIINHKYEKCFERLKNEWDPKLRENGVRMIPTDKDEYAKLVFSQPNYRSKSQRELEAEKEK